ncbi:hypothetical protein KFL_000660080 [Klebsormidium nitens]|uniref:Uncharacterized protein n=1 Tax=Klebsormidium nitens TaxID=105231 RepID=A0A1Y1HQJ9_KLENI|nr:hypothetical protein KFL_000660080 [Klebsormidium nitens]|eukprot:GAQ80914.1 hypothetical protein KFL_000660080 [Klebsormidium nitens]
MEPKVWDGERKAGLIKAKFDELYLKHFQNQSGVLSFPPQASPIHLHHTSPPAAPKNQPAKPSPNPQTFAPPVNPDFPEGTSQARSEGFSQPALAPVTFTGGRGAGSRGWPLEKDQGKALRCPPRNNSDEDLRSLDNAGRSRPSEQRALSGLSGGGQEKGCVRGLTKDVDGTWQTDCKEEGPSEEKVDTRWGGKACLDWLGSQSQEDLPQPDSEQPVRVVSALPEGALPRLSWAQLPDGATVIVVSPNLVTSFEGCPAKQNVVSPNLVASPNLDSGDWNGSQALLPVSPERLTIGDGGRRHMADGRSSEGAHSGLSGELGTGPKREFEAGEVIQGGSKRLRKGRGEAPICGAETGCADEGPAAAKSEGDLYAGTQKQDWKKAQGTKGGLNGKHAGGENKAKGRGGQTAGDRKPQEMRLQESRKKQGVGREKCKCKGGVETKAKNSRTARELMRLADMESKPGTKGEGIFGVKRRRVCSLAALTQSSGDAAVVDVGAHPSKKLKLLSGGSSLRSLGVTPPLLPMQKALRAGKAPAAVQRPGSNSLAAKCGLPRPQQQDIHHKQCEPSAEPTARLVVKSGAAPSNPKSFAGNGVCEPSVSNLMRQHEAGLAGKRRSEALEALAAAAREPMCSICYTEYDARRCYLACDVCDRWYHAESFGVSPEAAVALMKFKCPTCMRRGRPSGCPIPDPSAALAAPLKIRPKLHQKARIAYAASRGVVPGAQRAGLGEVSEEAQVEKRDQRLVSKDIVKSDGTGTRNRFIASAVVTESGQSTKQCKIGAPSDSGRGAKAKILESCETAVEVIGAPPAKKRPPLRLVGGTHPANLRNGVLTSNRELAPGGLAGCPLEERSSGRPLTTATRAENSASEAQGASECAALLAQPLTDSACLPHSAQATAVGRARGSPPSKKKASASEVINRVPVAGTPNGAEALGSSCSAEQETGRYRGESTAGGKARIREGGETENGTRKRIQPTKLGPVSQPSAIGVPKATEARRSEAPVLSEGPAVPRSAERSRDIPPAQSAPPHVQGPQGNLRESHAATGFPGGPVLPSVGRYSWEAQYYRAADEASRGGPVLPDRIHTGAPRGQSARWSIDLSKVQEVDGRKVRMGTEEVDGVQQLS